MKLNLLAYVLKLYLIVRDILADNFNARKNKLLNLEKLTKIKLGNKNNIQCQNLNEKHNKSCKTKRGEGKTSPDESSRDDSEIEKGKKYGEDIRAPAFYNPKNVDKKQALSSRLTHYTPTETNTFIKEHETALREYDNLMRKHQEDTEKDIEKNRVRQSLLTPYSAEETARFFATTNMNDKSKDDVCKGNGCNIMGGKKSRSKRRKGCKSRKRRKSRR